jgi:hypothetical protein
MFDSKNSKSIIYLTGKETSWSDKRADTFEVIADEVI